MSTGEWALLIGFSLNTAAIWFGTITPGEATLFVGLLVNAVAVWWGMRRIGGEVHKIEVATNSMKDDLVKSSKEASRAQGDAEGRASQKAEQAAADQ